MTTAATDAEGSGAHPRFAGALRDLGLEDVILQVRRFPEATRTAAEAAAALGCELSRICRSLIFAADGAPVLVLMDGASRVDVERVREELGAGRVTRAKAGVVRETTGYAIGGVPPFGHRTRTRVPADRSLLGHATVWAAAGTPYTVFPMGPRTLIAHAGGPSWTCASAPRDPAGDRGRPARRGHRRRPERHRAPDHRQAGRMHADLRRRAAGRTVGGAVRALPGGCAGTGRGALWNERFRR